MALPISKIASSGTPLRVRNCYLKNIQKDIKTKSEISSKEQAQCLLWCPNALKRKEYCTFFEKSKISTNRIYNRINDQVDPVKTIDFPVFKRINN